MKKAVERLMSGATRLLVLALGLGLVSTAWAVDKQNPVTGETESYSNVFTGGTSLEWNLADNWTLATESKVPFVSSGDYNAALVDGNTATSASTAIDGWRLRVGAYNGATVTWSSGITKIQASNTGCWLTADENSSITIASFGNNQLEGSDTYPFKLSSANAGGITWSAGLTGANNTSLPFWYYLKGTGTVVYGGDITVANAQVIKQADASLSGGSKSVESKDLVTFGSGTTKAFTADASVSIKQSAATKTTRTLKSVTAGGSPVKLASDTDWQVGTCELVQTSTGVKLYYVDGDYDTSYMAYVGDDPSANRHLSVADALAAIAADDTLPKKITLLLNTEEDIVIPSVDFVFDSNGKTITGTISGASGVGLSESAGVYTGISNTAATWTGAAGDGLWSNAQNWSTKSVPTSATTVTFDTDATVEMGETAEIYGLVVNSGKTFTLYRTGNSAGNQNSLWATLKIGAGQVTGGGTVKLICAGISKTIGSFTINANIEFQNNGTYDSFLEETASGSFVINGTVTGSGYLQVKTSTTFNGNVTIPEGSLIKVNSWTYNLGNNASLSGAGTLIFDGAGVQNSFKTAVQDSTKWTGTCELRSLTISNIDFADYANENSYVCANGLSGTFKGSSGVCRIADGIKGLKLTGNGLTVGGWSTDHTYVIAADISGAGPINLNIQSNAGNPLNAPASIDKVVFTGSTSDFTGQVSFKQSTYRPCYIFANESDLDSLPTPTDYGQIIVMAGKTVNVGSVWTAPGGFLINGEADTKSSSAYLSGTVLGNGTVKAAYTHSSDALRAPDFGNASENTFEITGMTGGWISNADANGMPNIKATVKLSGNVTINNGYGAGDTTSRVTTFKRLAGSGNLNFSFSTGSAYANYTISTINGATNANNPYTGTITANNKARVVIGVVDVDEVPLDGRRLVGIANSNRDRFVNASGTAINDNGLIDVTVGGTADTAKLYADTDGLYVAIAQVGDIYYKSLRAAADAARAADTTFTRVYAGAGDTYPGWTYSDGVFTYDNKVAYNATKDVAYATLQDAITASSAEDIIQLLEANSETAVDTTGKDFIFDENGYTFSGTWTGSGRIVLSSLPVKTTWASARFVSTGETIWTGAVALDWEDVVNGADLATQFNKYGISGSVVEIGENGTANGWFGSDLTPGLKVTGTLEVWNGSTGTRRNIASVTGSGRLLFTHWYNNGGETTYYKVGSLDNWTGVITNTSEKLTITTISSGTGVIYTSKALQADPTASAEWQGRVVLDYANIVSTSDISGKFNNKYGVSGSTVEIGENGTITGDSYFNSDLVPNLKVSGFVSVNDGSTNNRRVIPQISGGGLLVFGNNGAQVNYKVSNLVNWDGVITNKAANVRFVGFSSGNGVIVHDWAGSSSPYILAGHAGARVVINQSGSGHLASGNDAGNGAGNANFQGTLELAEGVTLTINNAWSGSNVTIGSLTGKGNLTVANTTHRWTGTVGYNIGTIDADSFTGTLTIGNEYNIGISKITRSAEPAYGTPYVKAAKTHADLASSTDGYFDVGSTTVEIAGEATSTKVVYGTIGEQSGLYKAVAQISTTYYATMQEAITAAGDNNLASITVLDGSAALPEGYYVSNNVVCKYAFSLTAANDAVTYYTNHGDAVYAAYMASTYKYLSILVDQDALTPDTSIRYKIADGVTVTPVAPTEEYDTPVQGTPDPSTGAFTYSLPTKATTYTWSGAYNLKVWAMPSNWTYGGGTAASRFPTTGDSVILGTAETITVGNVTVKGIAVSAAVTLSANDPRTLTASDDGIVLTDAAATITTSNVTLSPTPTTSVANSYVKLDGSTYLVDAYNTVTFDALYATVNRTDGLGNAIKDGDTITFTVGANQGYSVTGVFASSGSVSGDGPYSYVVDGNATITVTTQQDAQITGVAFDYYVGYTNADVRVTVDQAGTYTLTVGGKNYVYEKTGEASETITFENVDVTGVSTSSGVDYTITASEGASGTTGGTSPAQSPGTVTDSGWMAWSNGPSNVGTWDPSIPSYTESEAAFSGTNTYTAAWVSTGEVVTVTTSVKFGDVADPEMTIDADAQAAVRLFDDGGDTFQVLTNSALNAWANVSNVSLEPSGEEQYSVEVKLNYSTQTYGVKIGSYELALTDDSTVKSFPLAKASSAMQKVSYLGAGSFISLAGSYISAGYTADVGTDGSATNVVVSSDFVNDYLSGIKASEVAAALSPSATDSAYTGANGYNYFSNYALGLDPTDADDKPTIKVETNSEGKFVVTLVDGNGDPIVGAANVALTLKFQSGTDPNSLSTEMTSSFYDGSATINPSEMTGNVQYYKVQVDIGAK